MLPLHVNLNGEITKKLTFSHLSVHADSFFARFSDLSTSILNNAGEGNVCVSFQKQCSGYTGQSSSLSIGTISLIERGSDANSSQ